MSAPAWDLLVRGGTLVDPGRSISAKRDVAFSGGTVAALLRLEVSDASGVQRGRIVLGYQLDDFGRLAQIIRERAVEPARSGPAQRVFARARGRSPRRCTGRLPSLASRCGPGPTAGSRPPSSSSAA